MTASQKEKREVLRNDRLASTLHGRAINDLEPCGEHHEVAASLAGAGSDAGFSLAPAGVVEPAPVIPPTIKRGRRL